MGELRWSLSSLLQWRRKKWRQVHSSSFYFFNTSPFLQEHSKRSTSQFPTKEGFTNWVFFRNWAVKNPEGTMLDSSRLVNKQVGGTPWTGPTPVLAVNWTFTMGAAPANLAIPVPVLFWRLLPVPHLFPCSSIDWTTVFWIAPSHLIDTTI